MWITDNDVIKNKPDPEGYIKALNKFYKNKDLSKVIIFEDSYIGYLCLKNISLVSKVFIMKPDYWYFNKISECFYSVSNYSKFLTKEQIIIPDGNTQIEKVVIVACGKGTRLKPITNFIPKILVNIDHHNMFCKQILYWKNLILWNKEFNTLYI